MRNGRLLTTRIANGGWELDVYVNDNGDFSFRVRFGGISQRPIPATWGDVFTQSMGGCSDREILAEFQRIAALVFEALERLDRENGTEPLAI